VTKTIANQYPRGGIATFRTPVALTWRQRLGQAPNVGVVARDLFTTRKLLKSHLERKLLSPYSSRNVKVVRRFEPAERRRPLGVYVSLWQRLRSIRLL